jgi:hypothetical protein
VAQQGPRPFPLASPMSGTRPSSLSSALLPLLRPNRNRRREQGHATREGRFPLSPLPVVHTKPQSQSYTLVSCARQARTAHVKPMPPLPRNRLTPPATTVSFLTARESNWYRQSVHHSLAISKPYANPSRWTPHGLATSITVRQCHALSLAI